MFEHPDIGDNHNARVFRWCYQRMGEFIPELTDQGLRPRVMLEYSGTLLHGLRQMGANDVIDALRRITTDPRYAPAVEWLGCPWGHAVAPSTPVQDYRLHVRAWQHHFAALFGLEALGRVRGFSPSEMALPNHPDVGLRVRAHAGRLRLRLGARSGAHRGAAGRLRACAGRTCRTGWWPPARPARRPAIIAIVKTQGSDTKLVAQMQPYYEAKGLGREQLGSASVPPLVVQIADGENGGVMMNEFPSKYQEVVRECSGSATPLMNVTEYLDQLWAHRRPARRPARAAAALPAPHLGAHVPRRRPGPARRGRRRLQSRGRPLPHGGRQLDERHFLGARVRRRARSRWTGRARCSRSGSSPTVSRPPSGATATRCSTC